MRMTAQVRRQEEPRDWQWPLAAGAALDLVHALPSEDPDEDDDPWADDEDDDDEEDDEEEEEDEEPEWYVAATA